MPAQVADFRGARLELPAIEQYGRLLGHRTFWKLFAIENALRAVIHGVLSDQIGKGWWDVAVDKTTRNRAESFRASHAAAATRTALPSHDLYYVYLRDLVEIMRLHRHLFIRVIKDTDAWLVRIEGILYPRNFVAHMNHIAVHDRHQIDLVHKEIPGLLAQVAKNNLTALLP